MLERSETIYFNFQKITINFSKILLKIPKLLTKFHIVLKKLNQLKCFSLILYVNDSLENAENTKFQ